MAKKQVQRKPIGILDSGLGGLSVFREIKKQLPEESVIYFGDTLHAPYGEKTDEQIRGYVFSIIDFFIQQRVGLVIMACNTATAVALDEVSRKYTIPVIGVIQPGAQDAVCKTGNKKIGVIGTEVTIRNQSYEKIIRRMNHSILVFSHACSNEIIRNMEQGLTGHEIYLSLEQCLRPLMAYHIDTLVLGCTHYPFLIEYIRQIVGEKIQIVDPAVETVAQSKRLIKKQNMINDGQGDQDIFFVSGQSQQFSMAAQELLGYSLPKVLEIKK